jgi:hypothetical protein
MLVLLLAACRPAPATSSPDRGGPTTAPIEREGHDTTAPDASGPPTPFEDAEGRWGYRAADNSVVIAPRYAMATEFVDQVAGVVDEDGWVFIDRSGKLLARAFVFDNFADAFVEGRARIVEDDRHGFIASSGEIVLAPTYAFVEAFSEGRAAVCEGCTRETMGEVYRMVGGKWGYVDLQGKLVIPARYDEAGAFEGGVALVREGKRSLEIGPEGAER